MDGVTAILATPSRVSERSLRRFTISSGSIPHCNIVLPSSSKARCETIRLEFLENQAMASVGSMLDRGPYKRSWRPRTFFPQRSDGSGKKEKRTKKERKGRPVETAAAVEIGQGGLRRLFLDDFHRCLEKPTQKTLRLFHSSHRPGSD